MSLSRRLIETLIKKELTNSNNKYVSLDSEKLQELANQCFLLQVTQNDSKMVKKSLQEKIEHFHAIMDDKE
jgi:uncharacterized protein YcgL (UPF0745 family)